MRRSKPELETEYMNLLSALSKQSKRLSPWEVAELNMLATVALLVENIRSTEKTIPDMDYAKKRFREYGIRVEQSLIENC